MAFPLPDARQLRGDTCFSPQREHAHRPQRSVRTPLAEPRTTRGEYGQERLSENLSCHSIGFFSRCYHAPPLQDPRCRPPIDGTGDPDPDGGDPDKPSAVPMQTFEPLGAYFQQLWQQFGLCPSTIFQLRVVIQVLNTPVRATRGSI